MPSRAGKKKAILVEAVFNRKEGDHLAELTELAFVSGYEVVDRITQNLDRANPGYLFGKGKAKEIKGRIKTLEADVVIIENKLDSIQMANLKKMWHVEIIDRFELILEIFINRAGTQEAITQIRLAAFKKEGGSKISGHRELVARNRTIRQLEKKLELIRKSKDIRRKRRSQSGFDLVAIAGYTNAGKSTLMNAFTEADVEVSGRMFTTLDIRTRSFDAMGRKILITDTVGLISRLPHLLVEAFYATLREINDADLILLLIDGNDSVENIKKKVLASMNTFAAIEADRIPLIPVVNKIDMAQKLDEKIEVVKILLGKEPVQISAKNEINIDSLKHKILEILETYKFHLKISNTNEGMSLISKIHDKTRIIEETYHQDYVTLKFETNERMARYFYNIFQKENESVKIINQEALEKQIKAKDDNLEEDKYTILETESGEEFTVYDLAEGKVNQDTEKQITSELGLQTTLEEKSKEDD